MAYETIERDGYTIEIDAEEDCTFSNPRDWDNLSTMVCWHPDYILGDYQVTNEDGRGAIGGKPGRDTRFHRDDFKSMRHLYRYLGIAENAVGITPLYLYDHSGISMSAGSPNPFNFDAQGWDTSMVGFAYTTRERIRELCGDGAEYQAAEWIEEAIRGDVGTYNQYLTGDIWWYRIERDGETIESCGGYFGIEDCQAEANAILDDLVRDDEAKAAHERRLHRRLARFGAKFARAKSTALAVAAVLGIAVAVGYQALLADAGNLSHVCEAPCVVSFDAPNMQEDMFDIDYHDGRVDVFQVTP